MSKAQRFYSTSEAAEFLRVSVRTIYRRIDDGSLLVRQDGPRHRISIPEKELMNY